MADKEQSDTKEPVSAEITDNVTESIMKAEDAITFKTKEAFNERLDRHLRSTLKKEYGVESSDDLKAKLDVVKKYEEEREAARLAQLSNEQRLAEQIAALKAEKDRAEQALREREFEVRTTKLYSKLGIQDHEYANFRLQAAQKAVPEGQPFDEEGYFVSLLADSRHRAAFGVAEPAKPVDVPASNTYAYGQAPKPPIAGEPAKIANDKELSDADFKKKLRDLMQT